MLDFASDTRKPKKPLETDVHVGRRIRMRRAMLGMSQEKLGYAIGVTFQQVQKYEKGTNRVGSSRLQQIAGVLGVQVGWFFEGNPSAPASEPAPALADDILEFASSGEGVNLIRAWSEIKSTAARSQLLAVIKTVAAHQVN